MPGRDHARSSVAFMLHLASVRDCSLPAHGRGRTLYRVVSKIAGSEGQIRDCNAFAKNGKRELRRLQAGRRWSLGTQNSCRGGISRLLRSTRIDDGDPAERRRQEQPVLRHCDGQSAFHSGRTGRRSARLACIGRSLRRIGGNRGAGRPKPGVAVSIPFPQRKSDPEDPDCRDQYDGVATLCRGRAPSHEEARKAKDIAQGCLSP